MKHAPCVCAEEAAVAVSASGTCCSRASDFTQCWNRALGKHGPHRRAHNHMSRKTQPEQTINHYTAYLSRSSGGKMVIRHNTTVPAQECTSLKFGWVKKKIYLYSSVSPDERRRRIPDIQLDLPCAVRRRLGGEKKRRRRLCIFVLSLFPLPSSCYCNTLTSRPCHGSMLAFLFPASRDRVAAQLGGTGLVPRLPLAGPRGGSP